MQTHCVGITYNILMLNLTVHKATTRQRESPCYIPLYKDVLKLGSYGRIWTQDNARQTFSGS